MHIHNFKDLVKLISLCGGHEMCSHLLFGLKNAQYLFPQYISKFTEVMNDQIKNLLLVSLRSSYFIFFNDKT